MLVNVLMLTAEQAQYATDMSWDGPTDDAYLAPRPIEARAPYAWAGYSILPLGVRVDPEYADLAAWLLGLPVEQIETTDAFPPVEES